MKGAAVLNGNSGRPYPRTAAPGIVRVGLLLAVSRNGFLVVVQPMEGDHQVAI